MFSYIVAVFAALIFLSDPIARYFYPDMGNSSNSSSATSSSSIRPLSPRPRLNEDLLAIDATNASDPSCPEDSYISHVLSRAPLVVYLENFLSDDERDYLLETR